MQKRVPSLFTFHIDDKRLEKLSGIAVENVTDADLLDLSRGVERLGDAGSSSDFVRANTDFHSAIIALAGNPTLSRFYAQLQIQFHVVSYLAERGVNPAAAEIRQREHQDILNALQSRDAAALAKALQAHIRTTEIALLGS